jgi:hypothetical protein
VRVPDQSILVSEGDGIDHRQATRGNDYLFVYAPTGKPFEIRTGKISGKTLQAWWYDPRTGSATKIREVQNTGTLSFTPPGEAGRGNDWVLVLDDAGKHFPPPGKVYKQPAS